MGESLLFKSRQHPVHDAACPVFAGIVGTPAVPKLMVIPDHVGGEAVEDLLDAREPPVSAVDVPVPAQHRSLVRQQSLSLFAHPAVQIAPDVQGGNAVGVALIAAGDDQIDRVAVAAQRSAQEVPHLEIAHFGALSEKAALLVRHVAREERELERTAFLVRGWRAQSARAIVTEKNAVGVASMQHIAVARVRRQVCQFQDGCGVGIEVVDGEILPRKLGQRLQRLLHGQRYPGQTLPQISPGGRICKLVLRVQQERELPGPSGPQPQSSGGRGRMPHDGRDRQRRIRPRAIRFEDERVTCVDQVGHGNIAPLLRYGDPMGPDGGSKAGRRWGRASRNSVALRLRQVAGNLPNRKVGSAGWTVIFLILRGTLPAVRLPSTFASGSGLSR